MYSRISDEIYQKRIFPVAISKMIGEAFIIRNASDYDDMFAASKEDTEIQIANARFIYQMLHEHIVERLK